MAEWVKAHKSCLGACMTDPTIVCPNCKSEIHLSESLAAPLIAATRKQFEEQLAQKDASVARREQSLRDRENELANAKRDIDQEVRERVDTQLLTDRKKIIAEEAGRAKQAASAELEEKGREVADLQETMKKKDEKLAAAQKEQSELIKKQRALDDALRELDLTVEKRVETSLSDVRAKAKREAEESLKLKVMEKDQTIASMHQKIEELKQKAEQGSQQLQGEVQELELEGVLRAQFPLDTVEPVPKGEYGGDALQRIVSATGQSCGTILWESKRTKRWSDTWLTKLRDDQRAANADLAVIVTQVLPEGVETFSAVDGVWVTHPRAVVPVATVLRHTLTQVAIARHVAQGQQSKSELLYRYMTGSKFRQRVEAIVEAFTSMQEDLDKERKAITKQWAKRHEQIEHVMSATVGMYGDLQGIAGASIEEIQGLDLKILGFEDPSKVGT